MLTTENWCPFLGGLGSWKLNRKAQFTKLGFKLAGGEGSHARDDSSELLARMMLGKMFKCNRFRKYVDRGGTGF